MAQIDDDELMAISMVIQHGAERMIFNHPRSRNRPPHPRVGHQQPTDICAVWENTDYWPEYTGLHPSAFDYLFSALDGHLNEPLNLDMKYTMEQNAMRRHVRRKVDRRSRLANWCHMMNTNRSVWGKAMDMKVGVISSLCYTVALIIYVRITSLCVYHCECCCFPIWTDYNVCERSFICTERSFICTERAINGLLAVTAIYMMERTDIQCIAIYDFYIIPTLYL